jgi:hypothetical protein
MVLGSNRSERLDTGIQFPGMEGLMTADRIAVGVGAGAPATPKSTLSEILLDGLFTGIIGALIVALWFLALDTLAGRPLYTPALLGNIVLHGFSDANAGLLTIEPVAVAAYTAVHLLLFVAVGVVFSYAMTLFERFPIMFFVLLVAFVSLQAGLFVLDSVLGAAMFRQLAPWAVIVANLLASAGMAFYQWRRHPSVLGRINTLWQDDVDR